jgi:hypothetical protein
LTNGEHASLVPLALGCNVPLANTGLTRSRIAAVTAMTVEKQLQTGCCRGDEKNISHHH